MVIRRNLSWPNADLMATTASGCPLNCDLERWQSLCSQATNRWTLSQEALYFIGGIRWSPSAKIAERLHNPKRRNSLQAFDPRFSKPPVSAA